MQLDLGWMKVPTEWGIRVKPGKKGLTVGMINVGTYADIPDYWPYQTEMPRGAYPIPGVPSMGYSIFEKAELWADNAADLYEEAIQRRWRASFDIPWDTLEPLPDEVERAFCQLATALCEKALVTGDIIGKWLPEMSYGYHEVKLYLSCAEFDEARQFDVFRKRAFSNGGGMGIQSPGYFHRAMIDCPLLDRGLERDVHPAQQLHHGPVRDGPVRRPQRGRGQDLHRLHAGQGPPDGLRHAAPALLPLPPHRASPGDQPLVQQGRGRLQLRGREGRPAARGA